MPPPPALATEDSLTSTGHGCDTTAGLIATSSTVFAPGNKKIVLQGDSVAPHTITNPGTPPPACVDHPGQIVTGGSSTIFIEGKRAARVGDAADSGAIIDGASSVISG